MINLNVVRYVVVTLYVCDKVSDMGLRRIDRSFWRPHRISATKLAKYFDAHLIEQGFTRDNWVRIQPLIRLMFGNSSNGTQWCDTYASGFHHTLESNSI